jgi:hypothetical protein
MGMSERMVTNYCLGCEQREDRIERLSIELGEMKLVLESQDLWLKEFNEENTNLLATVISYQKGTVEKLEEIGRLQRERSEQDDFNENLVHEKSALRDEIARLREEFGQAVERIAEAWLGHDANKLDEAILAARKIAREGR